MIVLCHFYMCIWFVVGPSIVCLPYLLFLRCYMIVCGPCICLQVSVMLYDCAWPCSMFCYMIVIGSFFYCCWTLFLICCMIDSGNVLCVCVPFLYVMLYDCVLPFLYDLIWWCLALILLLFAIYEMLYDCVRPLCLCGHFWYVMWLCWAPFLCLCCLVCCDVI